MTVLIKTQRTWLSSSLGEDEYNVKCACLFRPSLWRLRGHSGSLRTASKWPNARDGEQDIEQGGQHGGKCLTCCIVIAPSGGRCDYSHFINDLRAQRLSASPEFPQRFGEEAGIKPKTVTCWSQNSVWTHLPQWSHWTSSKYCQCTAAFSQVHIRKLTCQVEPWFNQKIRLREFANSKVS